MLDTNLQQGAMLAPIRLTNAGSCPSRLAPIRPANAAAQLVLRTQAGRKEDATASLPLPLRGLVHYRPGRV